MASEGQSATEDTGGVPGIAVATVADPSYVEGRLHRLSQTLGGYLRVAIGSTVSQGYTSGKVSITRPANATPYTANDALGATAAAITFPTMGPTAGGQVIITSASLEIDVAAIPTGMTSFTLYLYNVTPPSALADNAAFDVPSGDRTALIGKISLGTPVDEGSTLKIKTDAINQQITVPSGGTIYGYLVTAGGFTPAGNSEVYVVTLHGVAL